ncbi:MAG: SsrA-binding protein SmpB [Patescibacteria group bacterium]
MATFADNKKAYFEYEILERYDAGLKLFGHEVKSIIHKGVNLAGAFVIIRGGEAYIINLNIPPYQPKNTPANYEEGRTIKLLLTKTELNHLIGVAETKGLTLIPLKLYNKNKRIKVEIGVARHKKLHDKRATIKQRETEREIDRTLKDY